LVVAHRRAWHSGRQRRENPYNQAAVESTPGIDSAFTIILPERLGDMQGFAYADCDREAAGCS